jgi:hypothetical protein
MRYEDHTLLARRLGNHLGVGENKFSWLATEKATQLRGLIYCVSINFKQGSVQPDSSLDKVLRR